MRRTILVGGLAVVLFACAQPAISRQGKKVELIGAMQRAVLQSTEAEKSAVLSITDEESTTFANESKKAAAEVERSRLELRRLVELDARPTELERLAAFEAAWRQLQAVDEKLLALAVSNTNLKAARLASGECATAFSGTPYFTANPGDQFRAWDCQLAGDFMPNGYVTFRLEYTHRAASVPYFSGHGGVTPPGGNQGTPGSQVEGWAPDLATSEDRLSLALMLKL